MWKMDKKVVFLDVDGTMVNEKGEIPESAQYAVRTAQANGHRMVVCSGRSRFQIYDALLELGFSGIVGGAGAFVEDEGKEFYHAYIDEEHRKSSFDYLESNGFLFCYQADDGVVLNQRSCDGMLKVYRDAGMSKERLDRLIGRMHLTEEPWKNEKNEKIIITAHRFRSQRFMRTWNHILMQWRSVWTEWVILRARSGSMASTRRQAWNGI